MSNPTDAEMKAADEALRDEWERLLSEGLPSVPALPPLNEELIYQALSATARREPRGERAARLRTRAGQMLSILTRRPALREASPMLDVQEALGNTTALPAIVWGLRVNRRIPALWRRQDGSWHMVERTGERDLTADEAAPFETAVGKVFL